MNLQSTKIIVGVTGGIAAYKSPVLVRRLIEQGAEVQVVMTQAACEFVRPLVFQAVSGNEVHVDLLDDKAEAGMGHIELARWADLILIAPATANTMARLTAGLADDLLATLCLATTARVVMAPAMNTVMWEHAATRTNTQTLEHRGVSMLGPGVGSQACGETGAGRMLEPDEIVEQLQKLTTKPQSSVCIAPGAMAGLDVVITAGPTVERIDPVRFLSNHSSGKMGYAMAGAALAAGASVTLISGPVNLQPPAGVTYLPVASAVDMQKSVMSCISSNGVFISVAAVADYRVDNQSDEKIKKSSESLALNLVRNPDILAGVATSDKPPFCVGFAAETQHLEQYARSKLEKKKLDMIVANLVGDGKTFGQDDNAAEVYWQGGSASFALQSKHSLASELIRLIAERYRLKNQTTYNN